ncbi:hypothetical protein ACFL6M_04595 [Candidatus Eisenbacteria bacterium]|uniref:Zinc-finger domain-containing protein n=1 Tax=Eiseniibacteriota bacterium TaxID=2212470 RepID=A0ABV6YKL5_UNCEI
MSEQCYSAEELAGIAGLPEDHPRRAHLADCACCRAQLILFRKFMDPALPAGAQEERAEEELTAAVRRKVWGEAESDSGRAEQDTLTLAREGRHLRAAFALRLLRPVLAIAAVVMAVLAVQQVWPPQRERPDNVILRGGSRETILVADPVRLPNGQIRLTWNALESNVVYRVVFYDVTQKEILRIDAAGDTVAILDPSEIPASEERAGLLWRVVAMRDGDELAASSTRTLSLR